MVVDRVFCDSFRRSLEGGRSVTTNGQLLVTWVVLLATRLCVMLLIHVVT